MAIKITNTLTGKKEEFHPISSGKVSIYLCGPTVYDEPHIGHIRSAYVFELIRRYFSFRGYKVKFVRNITDVDDKIIARAREENKADLKLAVKEIALRYHRIYNLSLLKMGLELPDIEPRATQHIAEMQDLIAKLLKKGYAYKTEGGIYFKVRKFKDYGKLSRKSIDELLNAVRIEPDEYKEDPLDFALWKSAKAEEPSWPSPWGEGRPGWHIECSAMSMAYLGENFDIHCGGRDLIFPHHENEIAQAEAATDKPFANYWLHNGLLTIEGEKMSKSLGNFITVDEIAKKGFSLNSLKIFFLGVHYSHPIDFSWERLNDAEKNYNRIKIFLNRISEVEKQKEESLQDEEKFKIYQKHIASIWQEFENAMDDDFNFPYAFAQLHELISLGNRIIDEHLLYYVTKLDLLALIREKISIICSLFLLTKDIETQAVDTFYLEELIDKIVSLRNELRKKKKYDLSDRIRSLLAEAGIILEDKGDTTTWRKERIVKGKT